MAWCVFAAVGAGLVGCAGGGEAGPSIDPGEGRALFPGGGTSARDDGAWTIVLAAFRGEEADKAARLAHDRVVNEGGLQGARVEQRGRAILLTLGRFGGPDDPEAAAELERVRGVQIRGFTPFERAILTPPLASTGTNPEHDLLNVHRTYGPGYIYTLQIGSYGRADGRPATDAERMEARRAAERAVATLRSEGEQAFYFHGPNYSSVTVGLFRAEEVDPQTGLRSPAFYDLQAKFPYNLLNGAERRVTLQGEEPQAQRSVLVGIPKR
ncbi:MAG: hypothetical protein NCW75_06675 [Phycisphaera sp.]|nr:MAG: hypothetical protein NCW75_06675 [Phycisphaera sp.]